MEPGTKFAVHVDQFKELVLQMESIGESLDETRQLVLLLGSLTEEYRMSATKTGELISTIKHLT
ncbi:hypothetical protein PI124_g12155 [Phytophthora idaei]|nr:hypothetical protein PI125_g10845 [Phytophthora idaei]KAG3166284.1 hypothetical protein PI126_g4269 [Phytophthora idaei]KAG3243024.1 hypothetical protein PI124_g12155 [Phytophthora idaei]